MTRRSPASEPATVNKPRLDLRAFRDELIKTREELIAIAAMSDEAAAPVELDQTRVGRLSRMDAMQAQAMSLAARRRREVQLARVAQALRRIDAEDFGYCEDCGEEIARGRLDFDPTATLCIGCANARED